MSKIILFSIVVIAAVASYVAIRILDQKLQSHDHIWYPFYAVTILLLLFWGLFGG